MSTNQPRGPRGGSRRGSSPAPVADERVEPVTGPVTDLVLDLDEISDIDRVADLELAGGPFKVRKSFTQRGRRWRPGEPFDTSLAKDIEVLERCGYIMKERVA